MSTELTRKNVPASRGLRRRNTMSFPRELRAAIPDLHAGRVLDLDSIAGRCCTTVFSHKQVQLRLVVKETGRLKGEFVVLMDLQPEAARKLAGTLKELADQAEPSA